MAQARCMASWRLCAPSFQHGCRWCVLTVFADTHSPAAISRADM